MAYFNTSERFSAHRRVSEIVLTGTSHVTSCFFVKVYSLNYVKSNTVHDEDNIPGSAYLIFNELSLLDMFRFLDLLSKDILSDESNYNNSITYSNLRSKLI